MDLEDIEISSLNFDPSNARKHSEKNLAAIKGSLAKFGQQKPIVIDNNNVVIAGNGTMAAAKALGWATIKAIRTKLTGPDAIAFALADNRTAELAEWDIDPLNKTLASLKDIDFDLGAIGFDDDFMKAHEPETVGTEGKTDPDAAPENVDTRCKPGDLWILGNHRLLCGDSTNIQHVERLMGNEKADMVFTDPPYGIDVVGGDKAVGGGNIVKSNRYDRIIGDMNPEVAHDACALLISLDIKPMVIWGANNFAHALPESSAWLYWQKNQTGDFADGELAWTNYKGQIKRFEHTWAGLIKASEHGHKRCHPTQKPIALAEWCFEKYGPESKTVLDLFLGSGSTLIACEKTNRKCFGMEIDPHYCDVILKRWEDFTGNKASLLTEA